MQKRPLVPVVLAGGRGTRLWPVSREARPKYFLRLDHGESMLQQTLRRAAQVADGLVVVAISADHFFQVDEDVRSIAPALAGLDVRYVLEPAPHGTAAATCVANRLVRDLVGEATLLVLPSDHLIGDEQAFRRSVEQARDIADDERLVAFSAESVLPETAYGYLQLGEPWADSPARVVECFVEKPDAETARAFLASGRFAWNTGIFCFTRDAIDTACAQFAPHVHAASDTAWRASTWDRGGNLVLPEAAFAGIPEISLDRAVMERSPQLVAIESDMKWADIGTWQAMTDLVQPDGNGNKVLGDAVLIDSSDTYVQTDGRLVAAVGVNNLVIVDTPDALLVGARQDLQKVRQVVEQLRVDGHEAGLVHRTVHRPWGTYTVIEAGDRHKIKRLRVKPGQALSLQMHYHRSEHWVVLQGTAQVINGDEEFLLEKDQATYIPAGNRHRLENPGLDDLVIVETQTGSYLGEDDIVRFDDDYGRAPPARPQTLPSAVQRH